MKKTIAWILALAMLSTSAMALAENTPPQMPQGENGQPPEMPNGQKPGNPPDGGMGGPGGQSGKPDSYDAVTTVSTDTEISGETIESTGKDENALLVTDGTTTVTNSTIVRDSDESTGGDQSSFYGVGAAVKKAGAAGKIKTVGFDTNAVSVGMLETGEMGALIVQNPFAMGYLSIKKAAELKNGEQPGEETIYTAVTAVKKENMYDPDIQKILFSFKKG